MRAYHETLNPYPKPYRILQWSGLSAYAHMPRVCGLEREQFHDSALDFIIFFVGAAAISSAISSTVPFLYNSPLDFELKMDATS